MLELHYSGGAHLYPIVITSVDIGAAPWLLNLNLKPKNGTALEMYPKPQRNKVMSDLAAEIRNILQRFSSAPTTLFRNNTGPIAKPIDRIPLQTDQRESTAVTPISSEESNSDSAIETTEQSIIQIYSDAATSVDWFSQFANVFGQQRTLSFNSQMLYTAPGGANLWCRMSSGDTKTTKAYLDAKAAFLANYQQVADELRFDCIDLIDLGVGDFKKGQLIIEYYLDDRKASRLNYFALDASYDMLRQAFGSSVSNRNSTLGRVDKAIGLHSPFSSLFKYKFLFSGPGQNIFLLLGNTLGNVREEQTLWEIKNGMYDRDILVTELQLIEPVPDTLDDITFDIQKTKYFYASPFTTVGCNLEEIDLWVEEDKDFLAGARIKQLRIISIVVFALLGKYFIQILIPLCGFPMKRFWFI